MNAQLQRALETRIEAFARDITSILQSAVADAVGDALGSKRGGGSVARGAGGRKLSSRSERIRADADALLRGVEKKGGQRMEQIAKSMGSSTKALGAPMRFLLKEKKVKRSGQARGTTYRAA